jgi:hypothetical protein
MKMNHVLTRTMMFVLMIGASHLSQAQTNNHNGQQLYKHQDGQFNPHSVFPNATNGSTPGNGVGIELTDNLSAHVEISGLGDSLLNLNHLTLPNTASGSLGLSYKF